MVEFALCLPILLLLLSAVIEYGFMLTSAMTLQDAARDGVRAGSRGQDDNHVLAIIANYAPRKAISSITTVITPTDTNGTALPAGTRIPGTRLKVACSATVQWMTPVQVLFGGSAYGLTAECIYRVE